MHILFISILVFILSACGQEKIDSSVSVNTLRKCEQVIPLPKGQTLTVFRDYYPYENTFRYDTYLCLYDSDHKLKEFIPYWGKIDSINNNTIWIRISKQHRKNKSPFNRLQNTIGDYKINYEFYNPTLRGATLTTNKLLDSLVFDSHSQKVMLYYTIKTDSNIHETRLVNIQQLRWEPAPSRIMAGGNQFYLWHIIDDGKTNYHEWFSPKDSLVADRYFQRILKMSH